MKFYSGNYSPFERARAERLALQQAMYVKQQREVAHLHTFVDRFRAKATKARQAQSRLKALERMEMISAAHVDTPFYFRFANRRAYPTRCCCSSTPLPVTATPRCSTSSSDAAAGRPRRPAGPQWRRQIDAGQTAGRRKVGAYGGDRKAATWRSAISPSTRSNSCAWTNPHSSTWPPGAATREQELRDYLGGFDFRGDMADAPCGHFSGGEKARLALALMVRTRAQPAPARRADQPPRPRDARSADRGAAGLRRRPGAGLARPPSAAHHGRRTLARGRRRGAPFDGDLDDYRDWVLSANRRERAGERNAFPAA